MDAWADRNSHEFRYRKSKKVTEFFDKNSVKLFQTVVSSNHGSRPIRRHERPAHDL